MTQTQNQRYMDVSYDSQYHQRFSIDTLWSSLLLFTLILSVRADRQIDS